MTEGSGTTNNVDFTIRWAVNISKWEPEEPEWDFLLENITEAEKEEVTKYRFKDDQKRSLAGRLLVRRCCEVALGVPASEVLIKRTKGKKPFCANQVSRPGAPNFNFNVSHEGDFVVIASEPVLICGVDCAAPQQLRRGKVHTMESIHQTFGKMFTQYEWETIFAAGETDTEKEDCFRCHWSLKEAFTKARGDGIAFELGRCEFVLDGPWPAEKAAVRVDGELQLGWVFSLHRLSGDHWVSVARCPPSEVIDANGEFKATFEKPVLTPDEIKTSLTAASPAVSLLCISDLLSPDKLSRYEEVGGDIF